MTKQEEIKGFVTFPYVKSLTDKIGKVQKKNQIKVAYKPVVKITSLLNSVKDKQDPKLCAGVYRISCQCGIPYFGEKGRNINIRQKEHLKDSEKGITKSAIAQHTVYTGHSIDK